MAEKVLFQTTLTQLSKTDIEGIGTLRRENDATYRWVKNASAYTALVAGGSCVKYNLYPATASEITKRVYTPDNTLAVTCYQTLPAGVPVTGIGISGSGTGCFGWVKVQGVEAVKVTAGGTAVTPGQMLISTSAGGWVPIPQALAPYTGVAMPALGAVLLQACSSVGPLTAQTCIVRLRCLD